MSRDVICLSHLRWGFVYQRPNHLMSRYAREGRVFFFEEPLFDDAITPHLEVHEAEPGLHVTIPHLPRETPREKVEGILRDLVDGLVADRSIHDPLLWFYTPMALGFSRHLKRAGVVYDCMDELTLFQGAPRILRERERQLFDIADVVFTGGESLYEAKRAQHPRVHAFPSSVDAVHFGRARVAPLREPPDQAAIPHPRAGYFGVIDERMDLALLDDVAQQRPDWQIVLVGPVVKIDPATLPQRPNIHYLGAKPYEALPDYLAGWDVAIMPFALNDSTRFISPTKTLEYLAAGKPVISTAIRDVVRPYGERDLVRIVGDANAFANALDESTHSGSAHRRERCDAFVARTSWDRTWSEMQELMRECLPRHNKNETQEKTVQCSITSS